MERPRRPQTLNGPSLGLARLMEQNFATFLWVPRGKRGWFEMEGTNGALYEAQDTCAAKEHNGQIH